MEKLLSDLVECGKTVCLKKIKDASNSELWGIYLSAQAHLFFDAEARWIEETAWWSQTKKVLEIGSGNGVYLSKLAERFPEKLFQGIEKLPPLVKQSNEDFGSSRLSFYEGDAEVFHKYWVGSADTILFRFTLQHLTDSIRALKNAWHYLVPGGYLLIIDSCDIARRSSHPISAIEDALQLVAERQREKGWGNRRVTLDLLKTLTMGKTFLDHPYELIFSNLDQEGKVLCSTIHFTERRNPKLGFGLNLLFLNLLHRTYQIPIDLDKAYDQLKDHLKDEKARTSPGIHFLILKKATLNTSMSKSLENHL
ncbi:MAG: class I SAM-dependent methyltransferase [Simkania sp.]|nr:class I SAM-dependent methyltransferase [Simkania sp.]